MDAYKNMCLLEQCEVLVGSKHLEGFKDLVATSPALTQFYQSMPRLVLWNWMQNKMGLEMLGDIGIINALATIPDPYDPDPFKMVDSILTVWKSKTMCRDDPGRWSLDHIVGMVERYTAICDAVADLHVCAYRTDITPCDEIVDRATMYNCLANGKESSQDIPSEDLSVEERAIHMRSHTLAHIVAFSYDAGRSSHPTEFSARSEWFDHIDDSLKKQAFEVLTDATARGGMEKFFPFQTSRAEHDEELVTLMQHLYRNIRDIEDHDNMPVYLCSWMGCE